MVELKVIGNNRQVVGSIPTTPTKTTHNGELPNMTPQRLKYYQEALASRLAQGFTLHPQLIKEFVKERIQNETSLRA